MSPRPVNVSPAPATSAALRNAEAGLDAPSGRPRSRTTSAASERKPAHEVIPRTLGAHFDFVATQLVTDAVESPHLGRAVHAAATGR